MILTIKGHQIQCSSQEGFLGHNKAEAPAVLRLNNLQEKADVQGWATEQGLQLCPANPIPYSSTRASDSYSVRDGQGRFLSVDDLQRYLDIDCSVSPSYL